MHDLVEFTLVWTRFEEWAFIAICVLELEAAEVLRGAADLIVDASQPDFSTFDKHLLLFIRELDVPVERWVTELHCVCDGWSEELGPVCFSSVPVVISSEVELISPVAACHKEVDLLHENEEAQEQNAENREVEVVGGW